MSSFSHDPKASPGRLRLTHEISNLAFSQARDMAYVQNHIVQDIYHEVTNKLFDDVVTVEKDEFITRYVLDVYVLTPSQLERLIQKKVQERERGMPSGYTYNVNDEF